MPGWGCPTGVQQTKEQTMTPLRARMIDDMKLAGLADKTQEVYQQAVRGLAKHYRRPPDQLSEAEVRRYLLDVKEQGAARGTFKTCHYGIQFFYRQTLGRDWPLFKKRSDCPSRSGCRRLSRMPRSSVSSAMSAIRFTRPALP
jgi:Phage integrase, N-terminal SAM-like domain